MAKTTLAVGDKIAFSAAFCRNTGQPYEVTRMRGTIASIESLGSNRLCKVDWSEGCPTSVLETNLARVGSRAFAEP